MQNNAKYFTFLFSHSSRSKIRIRRVRISKGLVQNGLLSIVLTFVVSTFGTGIYGVFGLSSVFGDQFAAISIHRAGETVASLKGPVSFDYSRPLASSRMALNSGGPMLAEIASEDVELENRLRLIETTGDPAFIPSIWAHLGKINNEFGFRRNPFGGRTYEFHSGMDIDGERGDIVVSPANGTVMKAGWQGGYGNMIELDHGNGLTTRYGHMSKLEVEVGDPITRGQLMGYVGSTGRSTGPHLHYELRLDDRPINPRRFLPPEPIQLN